MKQSKIKISIMGFVFLMGISAIGTLNAEDCCESDCGFFTGVDFHYWTLYESDLDFAVDNGVSSVSDYFINAGGKVHYVDYNWEPGFSTMLGYRLGCSQWDLRAIYTYYHNAASKTVKEANTPDEFLVQTNGSPNVGSTFSFQKGKNSLNYQTLDFVLGREFCLSDEISLYPFFGLRSIWLEQKLKSQASNTFAQEVRWSSNTRGLGAHLGSLLNVDLCNGLGVYLKSAASLLGCKNSYHHKILAFLGVDGFSQDLGDSLHLRGTGDQELLEITRANGAQYVPLASLEISAGLNWETILCGSCTTFSLGYDMIYYAHTPLVHRYFSLNPTVGASTNEMVGNILLHGLSFGANIAF